MTCMLNGCLGATHSVIHSLLRGDAHALGFRSKIGSNRVILMAKRILWWDYRHRTTFASLCLILICVL